MLRNTKQLKRHPDNSNLRLHHDSHWNGYPVYLKSGPLILDYLEDIDQVIKKSLQDYNRITVFRFDLRLPQGVFPSNENAISDFFENLKREIESDQAEKHREGKRTYPIQLRYMWAREQRGSDNPHFHCAIVLPTDSYRWMGRISQLENAPDEWNNTLGRIVKAWARALGLMPDTAKGLVHICDKGVYRLDKNHFSFSQVYSELFYRLSYMAKSKTKFYGNNRQNFRCSNH